MTPPQNQTSAVRSPAALVFAGGMALGAYQAGAYEYVAEAKEWQFDWLAGASIGAINAALIAGNSSENRVKRLREFWHEPDNLKSLGIVAPPFRYAQNWSSAIQARLFGAPGHFRPRWTGSALEDFKSLYDLTPLHRSLERLVDFDRLNAGGTRLTIATTDIESGQVVLFENKKDEITVSHLLASCGMLPDFAAVEIGGRLLGDGGLAANAPVESVLADATSRVVFVVDLFARDGGRPRSLAAAVARKNEIMFGNQTLRLLEFWREVSGKEGSETSVVYLSYRPEAHEADAEKLFDLSGASVNERWNAGAADMATALDWLRNHRPEKLTIVRR